MSVDNKAPLREVRLSERVLQGCLRHAFSTEKEEVAGLLLGRLESGRYPPLTSVADGDCALVGSSHEAKGCGSSSGGAAAASADLVDGKVAYIWAAHATERSVQSSDRVEMSPESLASAAEAAESVTKASGVATTVLGWYHSHPKIPVVPSAVDLRTQRQHQQHFESGWVGLIVSVFNAEAGLNRGHCALHCFQAGPCNEHIAIPVHVVPDTDLFTDSAPLHALQDSTADLLRVLHREIDNGVNSVVEKTQHNAAATRAARGLAEVQSSAVDGLVAEAMRRDLQKCTLPALRAEVARLEKALATAAASPSTGAS